MSDHHGLRYLNSQIKLNTMLNELNFSMNSLVIKQCPGTQNKAIDILSPLNSILSIMNMLNNLILLVFIIKFKMDCDHLDCIIKMETVCDGALPINLLYVPFGS